MNVDPYQHPSLLAIKDKHTKNNETQNLLHRNLVNSLMDSKILLLETCHSDWCQHLTAQFNELSLHTRVILEKNDFNKVLVFICSDKRLSEEKREDIFEVLNKEVKTGELSDLPDLWDTSVANRDNLMICCFKVWKKKKLDECITVRNLFDHTDCEFDSYLLEINDGREKWALISNPGSLNDLEKMLRRVEITRGWKNDISEINRDELMSQRIKSNKKFYKFLGVNEIESEYLAVAKVQGLLDNHLNIEKQKEVGRIVNEPISKVMEVLESGISKGFPIYHKINSLVYK